MLIISGGMRTLLLELAAATRVLKPNSIVEEPYVRGVIVRVATVPQSSDCPPESGGAAYVARIRPG